MLHCWTVVMLQALTRGGFVQELHYDLLVGCDGGGSTVRKKLQTVLRPSFCSCRKVLT